MCGDTSVHVSVLKKRISELQSLDPATGRNRLQLQLEVLETASPDEEEFDCSIAQLPDNMAKNRSKCHLPCECHLIFKVPCHGNLHISY